MQRSYHSGSRSITAEQCFKLDRLGWTKKYPETYAAAQQAIDRLVAENQPHPDDPRRITQTARDTARQPAQQIKAFKAIPYREYLLTDWWKKIKSAAIRRADSRCQVCYSRGLLNVHHRTYARLGCEMDNDLTVLCRRCHELFHELIPAPKK